MKDTIASVMSRINRARMTELLVETVNTYSPPFAESPATQVLAAALSQAGVMYSMQPVPWTSADDERGNLLVQLGPTPPALLLVGHVDTVELWHEEEAGARISGERLYGLGAADMKGGCAAIAEALIAVFESKVALKHGVCGAFVVGEEEDGDGAEALVELVNAPLTIVGEPTNLQPCTAHFGYLEIRLISNGQRAHAALPERGANAIHAMLTWLTNIIEESQKEPYAQLIAVNPREIHGGEPYFVVAEHCEAMIDFHVPPQIDREELEDIIARARNTVADSHPDVNLSYENLSWASGFRHHDADERLVRSGLIPMPMFLILPGRFRWSAVPAILPWPMAGVSMYPLPMSSAPRVFTARLSVKLASDESQPATPLTHVTQQTQ